MYHFIICGNETHCGSGIQLVSQLIIQQTLSMSSTVSILFILITVSVSTGLVYYMKCVDQLYFLTSEQLKTHLAQRFEKLAVTDQDIYFLYNSIMILIDDLLMAYGYSYL